MLLSIIVPIYNVKQYLEKCIESVINQNATNYELILIDDCSTDGSLSIAKKYENKSNVKIIKKENNTGLSDTRNIGLRKANGEYILFLDSDDYIEGGSLKNIESIIISQNYPDIVYFGFFEEDDNQKKYLKKYGYRSVKNSKFSGTEFAKSELMQRILYPAVCFGIYKRDFLISNNLFFKVGILHEDELWTPQVVLKAGIIYTSDYIYYHYVRRQNSITTQKDKFQNAIDLIHICKELDLLLQQIDDKKLYKLMNNHIAMIYMKAMTIGKLFDKNKRKYINRFYPLKKSYFLFDRAKSLLFAFNLKLYYLANNIK